MENLKTQLKNIGAEMSAHRAVIPPKNRPKYDVEAQDYFNALNAAAESGDAEKFNKLMEKWYYRVWIITAIPHCYLAPPALIRRDGESLEDYTNRCYQAHNELK